MANTYDVQVLTDVLRTLHPHPWYGPQALAEKIIAGLDAENVLLVSRFDPVMHEGSNVQEL